MEFLAQVADRIASFSWFEGIGLATGLLAVWLLIRQNILTWPVGLIYALVSVVVLADARLYANALLHLCYCGLNLYGWWYWVSGGQRSAPGPLAVGRTPGHQWGVLLIASVLGIIAMGFSLSHWTDAELVWWDGATMVLSFSAMWMMARKYIEHWWLWFVVDVVSVGLYLAKGLHFYALLYGVYLVMAVAGWLEWRKGLMPEGKTSHLAD